MTAPKFIASLPYSEGNDWELKAFNGIGITVLVNPEHGVYIIENDELKRIERPL